MPLRSDIIGVVLAGGASSRMGTDKALLPLGGAPIITYAAKALSSVFSEVVVSSGSGKRYAFLGLNEISDVFNDSGPLGGIHASLLAAERRPVFVVACDLPFVNRELVEYVLAHGEPTRTRIAESEGRLQPLFGLYDPNILPHVEQCLQKGLLSVVKALRGFEHDVVPIGPLLSFYRPNMFQNINTLSEYHSTSGSSFERHEP
ncbi:MAG TPA: hypothetical protein DEP53_15970 [Bacteroidetes bacterium]|nr:hypothetical protein [Bacteroidota bacterium]